MPLHPDFPEVDQTRDHWWWDQPVCDLATALEEGDYCSATAPAVRIEDRLTLADVEAVENYWVSYHGQVWAPDNEAGGSELDLYMLLRLKDGRYASVIAGNDYTGWGCQDFSDVRIGPRDEVIRYGLDNEGRRRLRLNI